MTEITICLDFLSPYAYVAWHEVQRVARARQLRLRPVPVVLAALLSHHGTRGPAEVPAKRGFTFKDAYRKASRAGLPPLTMPPTHPFNPLLALRVAALPLPGLEQHRVIDALFHATWASGRGVESAATVAATLDELGLDGPALVAQASLDESKDRLKQNTAWAIGAGVFGVPTMLVGEELFFGVDNVPFLTEHLDGQDPVAGLDSAAWSRVQPSATRGA